VQVPKSKIHNQGLTLTSKSNSCHGVLCTVAGSLNSESDGGRTGNKCRGQPRMEHLESLVWLLVHFREYTLSRIRMCEAVVKSKTNLLETKQIVLQDKRLGMQSRIFANLSCLAHPQALEQACTSKLLPQNVKHLVYFQRLLFVTGQFL